MFLEIGLTPNSAPVKDLVVLNERSEIIVSRDQSAYLKGFCSWGCYRRRRKAIAIAVRARRFSRHSAHTSTTENKFVKNKNLIEVGNRRYYDICLPLAES